MCEQMLKRMKATTAEDVAGWACIRGEAQGSMEAAWKARAEGCWRVMAAKRAKGTAKLTTDTFSTVRGEKRRAKEAAFLAEAEAEAGQTKKSRA